jgi:hypothetical protein
MNSLQFFTNVRQENCRTTRTWIVIALKRNGAYADNIQVPQLGSKQAV